MNQSVTINKVNWKKINKTLASSGLEQAEISVLSSLFNTIVETHTELSLLLFLRSYMFSVLFRLHHYLKSANMLKDPDGLKDVYDYIVSTIILTLEVAIETTLDDGLSFFITRIMNKIFDIESTNSARIVIGKDGISSHKIIVEPIVVLSSKKVSMDKAQEFVDFIFNLFSFCETGEKFVSVSVIFSSLWIKGFSGLPYIVDDTILTDFSNNPENAMVINELLIGRRKYLLEALSGLTDAIDMGDYSIKDFLRDEPDELYDDLLELKSNTDGGEDEEIEMLTEEELEEIGDEAVITAIIEAGLTGNALPEEIEDEIGMFGTYVRNLNAIINGPIPNSAVSKKKVSRNSEFDDFPRVRRLFTSNFGEELDLHGIIRVLHTYEKERNGKKDSVHPVEERIKIANAAVKAFKDEKQKKQELLDEIKEIPESFFADMIDNAMKDFPEASWFEFKAILNEDLEIYKKVGTKITPDIIRGIVKGYNSNRKRGAKISIKNVKKTEDGGIIFDRFQGKNPTDHCLVKDYTLMCAVAGEKGKES